MNAMRSYFNQITAVVIFTSLSPVNKSNFNRVCDGLQIVATHVDILPRVILFVVRAAYPRLKFSRICNICMYTYIHYIRIKAASRVPHLHLI